MAPPLPQQLHPLKVNPFTREAYLQLPPPHENIIITPPRMSDAPIATKLLNDPRVYKTLEGPPYPYLPEHAEQWFVTIKRESDAIFEALGNDDGHEDETPKLVVVDGCPVRCLREVQNDGTDIFLGDIGFRRCERFDHLRDPEQEKCLAERNKALPPGDPDIIWDVGDYLAPSHHGKGIMSAALQTLIHDWAVPRMNAKTIFGMAHTPNVGSVKVFQKNGFKTIDVVDDCVTIAEIKGGGVVGLHILEWKFTS
ncbi:hypothetical protein M0805_006274 [Coniferiporia weirii]|nr:hypothetical protein M0805_006274 [Coniferiporia weirii]